MNVSDLLQVAIQKQLAGDVEFAVRQYQQILKIEPRNPDAHHLLGCAYKDMGDFDRAIVSISTAISITPGQPSFFNNLSVCYLEKSEPVAAELCCRRALQIHPEYEDATNNLGLALMRQQRLQEAVDVLNQGLSLAPDSENLLCNLGNALSVMHHYQDAIRLFDKAIILNPQSALALQGKANCLSKLHRPEEVLSIVDTLQSITTAVAPEIMLIKGSALEVLGRLDEARDVYDTALLTAPASVELLFARTQVAKVEKDSQILNRLNQNKRQLQEISGLTKTQLCYALGKAQQDIGDFEAAAANYALGAENLLQMADYDEVADIRLIDITRQTQTRAYLDDLSKQSTVSEVPIFILGMPRSGTTLVEQILGSHPEVFPAGELSFVAEVLNGFVLPGGWTLNRDKEYGINANASLQERAEAYISRAKQLPGSGDKKYFTDKMPENYVNLGLIWAMFPDAKIIHCRRDPVDTCISCYNTLFANKHYWSYDFGLLGRHYRRYWELMQHWRMALSGQFLEVRYEEVVSNTESMAHKILEWCDLPWNERVLRFYETDRPVSTASVTQVRQPIYTSSTGRWKKWTPYIQPLLEEIGDIEKEYWAEVGKSIN